MAAATRAVIISDDGLLESVRRYKQYKQMVEELNVLIENEKVAIAVEVEKSGCSSIYVGDFKVTYSAVNTVRLDEEKFKNDLPEIYEKYHTKEGSYMKLVVK